MKIYSDKKTYYSHEYSLEKDFEKELIRLSGELFPSCFYSRWDPLLIDLISGEGVKPDGVIISHDLTKWWVVEVELARNHKKSHIIDQLGKLSRVDYTKCKKDLLSTLSKLGVDRPEKVSKNLVAETPELIMIIDKDNDKLTQIARDRNFSTLVVKPFRSSCGQVKLVVDNDLAITLEHTEETEPLLEIFSTKESRKKITNGVWWYKFESTMPFDNFGKIDMIDSEGSFPVLIEDIGGEPHLRLPKDRNSINEILKFNRIGRLETTNNSRQYKLTSGWGEI